VIRVLLRMSIRFLVGPGGQMLVVFGAVAAAWAFWAWTPLRPLASWTAPENETSLYRITPDGKSLVTVAAPPPQGGVISGVLSGPIRTWDMATGQIRMSLPGPGGRVADVKMAPDGSWLLALGEWWAVSLWNPHTEPRFVELRPPDKPDLKGSVTVKVSDDGKFIATDRSDCRAVQIWEGTSGRLVAEIVGARSPFAFTPDGKGLLATSPAKDGARGMIAGLWDIATRNQRLTLDGHGWPIGSVAVSPNGRLLATGLHIYCRIDDAAIPVDVKLWDAVTGKMVADVMEDPAGQYGAGSLGFSPDSRLMVLYGRGRGLVWDVSETPPRNRDDLIAVTESVFQGAPSLDSSRGPTFAPGGREWFVVGGQAQSISVADEPLATPRPLALPRLFGVATFLAHRPPAIFSPGGRALAVAASADIPNYGSGVRAIFNRVLHRGGNLLRHSTVRLYDPATRGELGSLPVVVGDYHLLDFTPDGQTFWTERMIPTWTGPPKWPVSPPVRLFEQWPVPPPGVPWWLIAVMAIGIVFFAADIWRMRRRWVARRVFGPVAHAAG
jgi:WD40 repeat protein